ncbi:MCE family protein [Pseudonocardia parietis]|uniref:Phospholipid/cholesterol/gamma-HCH transport system substrate-binding protein n=1 Tax=Pseudonocardia parietis TaxID=570936 RepID=A0ABS4VLJ8_9PSEU|nr:MCE family protein [Pseudonocardia parietis]MBP2364799.1 phospholipid/cholesterol/gamma-HCH transport system substrate-binding protein [Pseudonocardia parietis]
MTEPSPSKVRLVGVVFLVVLGMVFALAWALYTQSFRSTVTVSLQAGRVGLVMDTGNNVRLRGVEVGRVTAIEPTPQGAVLTLGLDPDQIGRIPADVIAEIVPTTAFGTKYVSLVEPPEPGPGRITEGAVLHNSAVTVELNDVFANLSRLLDSIDPAKVNATLGELARALDGRGDSIAALAAVTDGYLTDLSPKLPVLQRDLEALADVSQLYADVAPDLLRVLDNLTVTGRTVVDQADQLDAFLAGVTLLARTGDDVLRENHEGLVTALDVLRPTTDLLHEYEPGLTCFITGLDRTRQALEPGIGGASPEIRLNSTITLGQPPYENPRNLPKIGAANPPACHGLPFVDETERPTPQIRTDTGLDPHTGEVRPGRPPVAELLFGPLLTTEPSGGDS